MWIALLRAVNVGGTGKLAMADLRTICGACGFTGVRTYIASGNAVFSAAASEAEVKAALEAALEHHAGKPVGVVVRSRDEMAAVLAANPFPEAAGNRVAAIFLDAAPPADALDGIGGQAGERLSLGCREIYVDYAGGMRDTKLRIPAARHGTARNLTTVAALAALATSPAA